MSPCLSICDTDWPWFGNPTWPSSAGGEAPRPEADFGEKLSPYCHDSPARHPVTLIRQHGTSRGWEWGPQWGWGCVHACTSVCDCAHVCTAQMDSNRQRFQECVPAALIAAACGNYKYSNSRTKIGIYALLHLQRAATRQGRWVAPSAISEAHPLPRQGRVHGARCQRRGDALQPAHAALRSPRPSDFVCPAVPTCSAQAVPARGNLSRCANKPPSVEKGLWPTDRRGDSPGGGFAVGDSS